MKHAKQVNLTHMELLTIKDLLAKEIRNSIKLNKDLGVKYPYYYTDKEEIELYKHIIKEIKQY